jgi:hypothetical protein
VGLDAVCRGDLLKVGGTSRGHSGVWGSVYWCVHRTVNRSFVHPSGRL